MVPAVLLNNAKIHPFQWRKREEVSGECRARNMGEKHLVALKVPPYFGSVLPVHPSLPIQPPKHLWLNNSFTRINDLLLQVSPASGILKDILFNLANSFSTRHMFLKIFELTDKVKPSFREVRPLYRLFSDISVSFPCLNLGFLRQGERNLGAVILRNKSKGLSRKKLRKVTPNVCYQTGHHYGQQSLDPPTSWRLSEKPYWCDAGLSTWGDEKAEVAHLLLVKHCHMERSYFLPFGFVHASEWQNTFPQASLQGCDKEVHRRKHNTHSAAKTRGSLVSLVMPGSHSSDWIKSD